MTKIHSLAEWNENKTIQQNAEHLGICYQHASVVAREHHLNYKRKNGGEILRLVSHTPGNEDKFRPDKMYFNNGQTFGGEGAD